MHDFRDQLSKVLGAGLAVEEPIYLAEYERAVNGGNDLSIYEIGFGLFSMYVRYGAADKALHYLRELDGLNVPATHRLNYLTNVKLLENLEAPAAVTERIDRDIASAGRVDPSDYIESIGLRSLRLYLAVEELEDHDFEDVLTDICLLPVYNRFLVRAIVSFARSKRALPLMADALTAMAIAVSWQEGGQGSAILSEIDEAKSIVACRL